MKYCEECGAVPLYHRLEKISTTIDLALRRFILTRFIFEVMERAGVYMVAHTNHDRVARRLAFFARLRLLTEKTDAEGETNTRVCALYEGAAARGVTLKRYMLFGTTQLCCVAEKQIGGKMERVVFRIVPRPRGFVSPSLLWMDNKGILKGKLAEAHIPHADGGVARTFKEALALFHKIGAAVIIKPTLGSRGRHTTLDIRTEEELRKGFDIGMQITSEVVVERYLHGTVHRVTLVGGKPVAVARREYPHVIGDGVHTVEELIDIENARPLRHGIHYRPLDKVNRIQASLKKQDLTFTSVPLKDQLVVLSDKNSRLHGTVTEDVTDTVHPDNGALFERLGEMLGDPIVGVDFMIGDMSRSWKEQPEAGVLECNSMPFIDVHHEVVSGRKINVAAYLWDVIFPPTTRG